MVLVALEVFRKKILVKLLRNTLFIEYANNDKLFVPVDQADKVNKYIGADGSSPKVDQAWFC